MAGRWSQRDVEKLEAIDRIYAQLPTIVCKRKCTIACGAVVLTDLEARRLQVTAHVKPRTIPLTLDSGKTIERCIYLQGERVCKVYDVRPLICRVFGLVKMLSCMHGCVPDRWLSDLDYLQLATLVERLGGGRVLHTTPEGLAYRGESFSRFPAPQRSVEAIEADAERTRNLRAIFGGRIVAAIDHRDD
jgi:Fe-S-cluster containining protein